MQLQAGNGDRAGTPVSSCPGCLSWGPSYGSQSYCRACYDFVARYPRAICTGCRRLIAVKKGHCRLCWLQAAIVAEGSPRITAQDFQPTRYQQLSLAGLTRLGHTSPPAETDQDEPLQPPPDPDQMQLKLFPLGESWLAGRLPVSEGRSDLLIRHHAYPGGGPFSLGHP